MIEKAKLVDPATDPFTELTVGYDYTTKWVPEVDKDWGTLKYKLGEERTEVVNMSTARQCSYGRYNKSERRYETIVLGESSSSDARIDLSKKLNLKLKSKKDERSKR